MSPLFIMVESIDAAKPNKNIDNVTWHGGGGSNMLNKWQELVAIYQHKYLVLNKNRLSNNEAEQRKNISSRWTLQKGSYNKIGNGFLQQIIRQKLYILMPNNIIARPDLIENLLNIKLSTQYLTASS